MSQFTFEAIGTHWEIEVFKSLSYADEQRLFVAVKDRIDRFDKAYSRFREDSLVTAISKRVGVFLFPDDGALMLSLYHDLYMRTNGLLTPLIGNLMSDAGYDAQYSLKQKKRLESPPAWDDALEYRHPYLIVKMPVLLDFGAAGKGYLIDLVAEVLEANSTAEYCIDAGGDILLKGRPPQRIGLEDPDDTSKAVGICTLVGGSICGSAGNRRQWEKFTHIIDPKSRKSPTKISAVWVTAETAIIADALATCLFFVEPAVLAGAYVFEYVRLYENRSFEKSPGFSGEMFTA